MFTSKAVKWSILLNVAATQVTAWLCILGACRRTRFARQEAGGGPALSRWRERFARWRRAKPKRQAAWRELMLERSPIAWLEGRDLLQERLLWAMCLTCCILLAVVRLHYPDDWPSGDWLVIWGLWTHYILCIWVAIQAPRRLGDDKYSGALELVLCTPISTREIVRGNLQLLRRRFGRALIVLMGLDAFLVYAFCTNHGGWERFASGADGLLYVVSCGVVVFPLQIGSLARIGIYQGLVHPNSSRATFMLLLKLVVLPFLLFVAFMISWEYARPRLKLGNMTDWGAFCVWTCAHVLVFAVFVIQATRQLRHNFRVLAASAPRGSLWTRLLEARDRFRQSLNLGRSPTVALD